MAPGAAPPASAAPQNRRRGWDDEGRRARAERFYASLVETGSGEIRVLHAPGEEAAREAEALLARRRAASKRMAARLAKLRGASRIAGEGSVREEASGPVPLGPVRFVLFPSLETKVMLTGTAEEAGSDPERRGLVPIVQRGDVEIEDLAHARALARLLMRARPKGTEGDTPEAQSTAANESAPGPAALALEWGIAVHLLGAYKGGPAGAAAARLDGAKVLPTIEEMFHPREDAPRISPMFLAPAAGVLVDWIVARIGPAAFLEAAKSEDPAAAIARRVADSDSTERGLAILSGAWRAALPRSAPPRPRRAPQSFHRGVCLAHMNYPSRGYGGEKIGETLDELRARGIDWISVTPFGYQRAPSDCGIHYVLHGGWDETDEALRRVIREAHARGLRVLYKPHLWVGHGAWCGEIAMRDEEGWAEWFESYRRYIVHHALVAEEERAEIFAVGNELVGTARRERDWRATIRSVRAVFGGELVYAANWWEEAESIAFWDALDLVGVNDYYPLSDDPEASDADLLAGARAIASRIAAIGRRARRPVLLTEVGFAARPGCWLDPHREARGTVDVSAQARAYRAVLAVFAPGTDPPVRGLYWWKFESDSSAGGGDDESFTPQGKPAEEEMSAAYRRIAARQERKLVR